MSSGKNPATALQQAKLQWLQQQNGQQFQKLPYYWAGMVYSGDNEPVETDQQSKYSKYWWLAAIVVPGILIFFFKRNRLGPGKNAVF